MHRDCLNPFSSHLNYFTSMKVQYTFRTGEVVVDLCAFDDGNIITNVSREKMQTTEYMMSLPAALTKRYILPLDLDGKVLYFTE